MSNKKNDEKKSYLNDLRMLENGKAATKKKKSVGGRICNVINIYKAAHWQLEEFFIIQLYKTIRVLSLFSGSRRDVLSRADNG